MEFINDENLLAQINIVRTEILKHKDDSQKNSLLWGMSCYYKVTDTSSVDIVDVTNAKVQTITLLVQSNPELTIDFWKNHFKNDTATLRDIKEYEEFTIPILRGQKLDKITKMIRGGA